MFSFIEKKRFRLPHRVFSAFAALAFVFSAVMPPTPVFGQQVLPPALNLPLPGTMVTLTPSFNPSLVKGITIHPENPLKFDFLVSPGDDNLAGTAFREESKKLIKYFLASLTVPDEELWVNLSPYEENRIIAAQFGRTEMGRDMLAQDYILKQLSASLMYPENDLGKIFWDKVYKKAYEKYGTTEIPMNTFNKIWIVPEKAVVYEHEQTAFVIESHLKVMLEEDYNALQKSMGASQFGLDHVTGNDTEVISGATSEVVREVLLPEIEREVNTGELFAQLRQIYQSLILATWYKDNLRESLLGHIYVDKGKTKGVHVEDAQANQKIYDRYVEAFKTGVYNYIKEDFDSDTQQVIPRKYFSGGNNFSRTRGLRVDTRFVTPRQAADASSPIQKVEVDLYADNAAIEAAIANIESALPSVIIEPKAGTKNARYRFEIVDNPVKKNAYITVTDYYEQITIEVALNNALASDVAIGDQLRSFIEKYPLNNGINDLNLVTLQKRITDHLKKISASSPVVFPRMVGITRESIKGYDLNRLGSLLRSTENEISRLHNSPNHPSAEILANELNIMMSNKRLIEELISDKRGQTDSDEDPSASSPVNFVITEILSIFQQFYSDDIAALRALSKVELTPADKKIIPQGLVRALEDIAFALRKKSIDIIPATDRKTLIDAVRKSLPRDGYRSSSPITTEKGTWQTINAGNRDYDIIITIAATSSPKGKIELSKKGDKLFSTIFEYTREKGRKDNVNLAASVVKQVLRHFTPKQGEEIYDELRRLKTEIENKLPDRLLEPASSSPVESENILENIYQVMTQKGVKNGDEFTLEFVIENYPGTADREAILNALRASSEYTPPQEGKSLWKVAWKIQRRKPESSSPIQDTSAGQRNTNPGGIDFNPALLDLQIKRDGNGIPLPFHLQPVEVMSIEGLIPVIINVTPVLNVPLLLGLDNTGQGTAGEAAHSTLKGPMEPRKQFKAVEPEQVSLNIN